MIHQLREWYALNKGVLNQKGICKSLGLEPSYLAKFTNNGMITKQALPKLLEFALEKGFKLECEQTEFFLEDAFDAYKSEKKRESRKALKE